MTVGVESMQVQGSLSSPLDPEPDQRAVKQCRGTAQRLRHV